MNEVEYGFNGRVGVHYRSAMRSRFSHDKHLVGGVSEEYQASFRVKADRLNSLI